MDGFEAWARANLVKCCAGVRAARPASQQRHRASRDLVMTSIASFYQVVALAAFFPLVSWMRYALFHPGGTRGEYALSHLIPVIVPCSLIMCVITASAAWTLSGDPQSVAGVVLLSIGGTCNFVSCSTKFCCQVGMDLNSDRGGRDCDRAGPDETCWPIGFWYTPVLLTIGGAALHYSDGNDGLFEVGVSFLVTGLCFCVCWVMSRMRACQVQSEDGKKKLLKEEETAAAARAIWEQGASDAVVTQPV